MKRSLLSGATLAAASILTFSSLPSDGSQQGTESASKQIPVTVMETIDGDTIRVRMNGRVETVRYLLVDTPESRRPDTCVQFFAKEAFQRNHELVTRGTVTVEMEQAHTRDAYGRLLAYVYVDGVSVQERLLQEGYARVAYVLDPPYQYLETFRKSEQVARAKKLRIWSKRGFVTSWGFEGCGE